MKINARDGALKDLCVELGADSRVSGILLFGSYARGEARPDSDIDLLVVRDGSFSKVVTHRNGVEFEVFFNNESDIIEFWKTNLDDFASFWADAQVLFDRGGATERLAAAAARIRSSASDS